jgi:pyridoxamine 5'-phosphate oxidase
MTELRRSDLAPDPFAQFDAWYRDALAAHVVAPDAMTLATASKECIPSARMVLLKGYDQRGFVFYTNYESQKGRELAENPHAALVFYWAELQRQVRISGRVTKLSREESERYFASRPLGSRLSAWASHQSEVIASRAVLEERVRAVRARFAGGKVPLPPYWGGYVVAPVELEFWQGRPDRLHDRFRYSLQPDQTWLIQRLSP